MILYKRNAAGTPIFWTINKENNKIIINYGIVGKQGHTDIIITNRGIDEEIASDIKAKYKEGYKQLQDLFDNAPSTIPDNQNLIQYLDTYLPQYNTHKDGNFIPML